MCRGPAPGACMVPGPTARLVWHSHDFVTDWCLPMWTVAWPETPPTTHCGAARTVPILLEWGKLPHALPVPLLQ